VSESGGRFAGLCRCSGLDNRRRVLAEISDRLMETLRVDLLRPWFARFGLIACLGFASFDFRLVIFIHVPTTYVMDMVTLTRKSSASSDFA
jgi:hypothetical protein